MLKTTSIMAFMIMLFLSGQSQMADVDYRIRIWNVTHMDTENNPCHNPSAWGTESESNVELVTEFTIEDDANTSPVVYDFQYVRFADQDEWYTYAEDVSYYVTSKASTITLTTDAWEEDGDEDFSQSTVSFWNTHDDCRVKKTFTFADFRSGTPTGLTGQKFSSVLDNDGNKWRIHMYFYWGYGGDSHDLDVTYVHQTVTDLAGDVRSHTVDLVAGRRYIFNTTLGLSNYLRLYGSDGETVVAEDGSSANGTLGKIIYTPTVSGTYYLENSSPVHSSGKGPLLVPTEVEYYYGDECGTNPSEFGNGEWAVHFYPGKEFPQVNDASYAGKYMVPVGTYSPSFASTDYFPANGSPVEATGYVGCYTPHTQYTLWYRGLNLPCGGYKVTAREDDHRLKMYIDGNLVADGTFDRDETVFEGNIRSGDEVEVITYVGPNHSGEHELNFSHRRTGVTGTLPTSVNETHYCGGLVRLDLDPNDLGTPGTYGSYAFYQGSCGGTYVGDEDGFLTSINTPTTFYLGYADACGTQEGNCLTITVDPHLEPLAGDDQTVECTDSTFLEGNTSGSLLGVWRVVSGSGTFADANDPNTKVTGLSEGENTFRWSFTSGACQSLEDQVVITRVVSEGNPDKYGNGKWLVYGYNERGMNPSSSSYRGFYKHFAGSYSYDTEDVWAKEGAISAASNWKGCSMPNDDFGYSYRRTNFSCGDYNIYVGEHRHAVRLYIDDVLIHHYAGSGGPYTTPVWTGELDEDSRVEIRQSAFSNSTYHSVIFQRFSFCNNFPFKNGGSEGMGNGFESSFEVFPNPFAGQTSLRFSTPVDGQASLQIFDLSGKLIATPFEGQVEAGVSYTAEFAPTQASSGIYMAVLKSSDGSVVNRKLMHVK